MHSQEEPIQLPELINGCIRHHQRYQTVLYNRYHQMLWDLAYKRTSNPHDAEDVLQDAFIAIFENLHQYKGTGSFEGWLRRIVINKANSYYIQKKKHKTESISALPVQDIVDYSSNLWNNDFMLKNLLYQFIAELTPQRRFIFEKYVIEGYSHDEIANQLGCTASNTRSQLYRAKQDLKEKLKHMKLLRT